MTNPTTIGEKIRHLRKSMGLTQSELAGDFMTKSMLSQIENGRAYPSMRTLQYLASRLKQDPAYFLEEPSAVPIRDLLREVEQAAKAKDYEQVIARIKPVLDDLPATVDAARLLEYYVAACFYTGSEGEQAEQAVQQAVEIYERFGLYVESVKVKYMRYALLFTKEAYMESLRLIRSLQKEYNSKQTSRDILFEIQLYYAESVSLSAVGQYAESRDVMLKALQLSKEEGVFHLTDHFYRMLAQSCMLTGETEHLWDYLKKARMFAEVAESEESLSYVEHTELRILNWEGRHEDVLQRAKQAANLRRFDEENYWLQIGIAQYALGRYEEALNALSRIQTPRRQSDLHPLDKARAYSAYAYRALTLAKLGRIEEAEEQAIIAYERTRGYPPSPDLVFIEETYRSLLS